MTGDTTTRGGKVSGSGTKMGGVDNDEDDLDQLVQKASIPNLASLFRKGKEKGLIQAQQEYGHTT